MAAVYPAAVRISTSLLCTLLVMGCGARSSMQSDTNGAGSASGGAGGAGGSGAVGGAGPVTSTGVGASGGTGGGGPAMSVVEACVIAVSCGRTGGWTDFTPSACVDGFARLGWRFDSPGSLPDPDIAQRLLDCAAKTAGECKAFQSCFGGDWVSLSRCREGGSCLENTVTSSIEGPSFDCGSIASTCADLWSNAQRACCNAEPCPEGTAVECEGTVATFCGGWGEHVTFDCGPSGRACNAGTFDFWTPCVGDGACDPTSLIACEGDVAVYCSGGGLAKYDCSKTGYRTACNGGAPSSEPACRPQGSECAPEWEPSTCDGPAIRVCVDGAWVNVDCASVGFAGCEEQQGGARCVPM